MPELHFKSTFDCSAEDLWKFHASTGAFHRLAPPWQRLQLISWKGGIADGARLSIDMRLGPARLRWEALHSGLIEGSQFCDRQLRGPFARWFHTHLVSADGPNRSILTDQIEYRLPGGALGALIGDAKVRTDLRSMFAFRHRRTADDIARHRAVVPMGRIRIAVSGSSGFIGSALVPFLLNGGHSVDRLVRPASRINSVGLPTGVIEWDPVAGGGIGARGGFIDLSGLKGVDAVVHLAGASVIKGRWSRRRRRELRDSRIASTTLLARALASLNRPPRVLLCASGTGIYRPDAAPTDESGPQDDTFIAELVRDWEAAARPAQDAGIRTVFMRIGIAIGAQGGALAAMQTPYSLGLGGRVGSGRQHFSWIALDDVVGAIHHCLFDARLAGPVNFTAPAAVTNDAFTAAVARVLGRWRLFPIPAWALRVAIGEVAQAVIGDSNVRPACLLQSGFRFRHADLESALRMELGRLSPPGEAASGGRG